MSNSPTTPVPEDELRELIEKALHIDWAFGTHHSEIASDLNHSKPDKIIVQGYPKGAYHTSYDKFITNITDAAKSYGDRRELEGLRRLEDQSDCIEDSCGLDADLLVHNLLARIRELEKSDEPSITPNMKEVEL